MKEREERAEHELREARPLRVTKDLVGTLRSLDFTASMIKKIMKSLT